MGHLGMDQYQIYQESSGHEHPNKRHSFSLGVHGSTKWSKVNQLLYNYNCTNITMENPPHVCEWFTSLLLRLNSDGDRKPSLSGQTNHPNLKMSDTQANAWKKPHWLLHLDAIHANATKYLQQTNTRVTICNHHLTLVFHCNKQILG